jgi:hypothetical protein
MPAVGVSKVSVYSLVSPKVAGKLVEAGLAHLPKK